MLGELSPLGRRMNVFVGEVVNAGRAEPLGENGLQLGNRPPPNSLLMVTACQEMRMT